MIHFNEKNILAPSKALKDLTILSEKISVKSDVAFKVLKGIEPVIDVNVAKRYVETTANILLFVQKDTFEESYCTFIKLDTILRLSFTSFNETSTEYIFFLEKGNDLIASNIFVETIANASDTFKGFMSGKLDKVVPKPSYTDILKQVKEVMQNNQIKGHQSISYEILLTELAKDINNPSKSFRFSATKSNLTKGYKLINIREISRGQSAMSALASENIMASITTTISNTNKGVTPKLTPVEQISLNKFN